jgi:hypothetical protein
MAGIPGAEGGIPMGPGTVAQGPTPTLQQATAPTEHKYVTPYEKMAYETAQRAQMLQQRGFGRSAFTLEQQATQYQQMHQNMALQQAGRAMVSGNYSNAIPYLNSVGFEATSIAPDPSDPEQLLISHPDGSQTTVPRMVAGMIAADPTKLAEALPMMQYRKAMSDAAMSRADSSQTRATAYAKGQESLAEHRQEQDRIAEKRVDAQRSAFGPGGAKTPAKQILWDAAEAKARQLNPGASEEEIFRKTSEDPRVSTARTNPQAGLSMQIRSYQAEQKNYLAPDGRAPVNDPKDPLAQRYYELQGKIDEARNALMRPTAHTPTATPQTPGGLTEEQRRDNALALAGNDQTKINKIWDIYKSRTGKR